MDGATGDWFVHIEIAVANFQVETAIGFGADPGLVMDGGSLAAEIRQRNKVTRLTFLALWKA